MVDDLKAFDTLSSSSAASTYTSPRPITDMKSV
jgi:hypothetical protein